MTILAPDLNSDLRIGILIWSHLRFWLHQVFPLFLDLKPFPRFQPFPFVRPYVRTYVPMRHILTMQAIVCDSKTVLTTYEGIRCQWTTTTDTAETFCRRLGLRRNLRGWQNPERTNRGCRNWIHFHSPRSIWFVETSRPNLLWQNGGNDVITF